MGGTLFANTVVFAREIKDVANANHIVQGSVVKAIYVELWILAGSQQPGSFTITVEKVPAAAPAMTFLQNAQLSDYPNKKNILYTTQGVSGDANTNPIPVIRSWIKIPRGKQRFGLDDKININYSANVEDMTICGVIIYKAYT